MLETLNPDDMFGVVLFDNLVWLNGGCFRNSLAVANPYNIAEAIAWLTNTYSPFGGTNYYGGFDAAFDLRDGSVDKRDTTAIVFLTGQ